jgi:polyhydroxybutyrate depolymerase
MSGQAWNVGPCCVAPINGKPVDDVAFAKAIVQDIESIACIDSKRVYAVGFSMGGGMSHWLGCNAADVFAAVGPASFDLVQENQDQCHPSRPIPVMMWRGKQDTLVCYDGCNSPMVKDMTITFLGAVKCFQKWASLDGCTGNPSAADSNGCQTYSQCSGGAQVTLCTHATGSHEAADANIIWPMLKKFSLP